MNYLNYRVNPLIQTLSTETLQQCIDSLSYISESINGLNDAADMPPRVYRGLQGIIDCIGLALEYEYYRLQDEYPEPVNH